MENPPNVLAVRKFHFDRCEHGFIPLSLYDPLGGTVVESFPHDAPEVRRRTFTDFRAKPSHLVIATAAVIRSPCGYYSECLREGYKEVHGIKHLMISTNARADEMDSWVAAEGEGMDTLDALVRSSVAESMEHREMLHPPTGPRGFERVGTLYTPTHEGDGYVAMVYRVEQDTPPRRPDVEYHSPEDVLSLKNKWSLWSVALAHRLKENPL